jgi:hypothetical protein
MQDTSSSLAQGRRMGKKNHILRSWIEAGIVGHFWEVSLVHIDERLEYR